MYCVVWCCVSSLSFSLCKSKKRFWGKKVNNFPLLIVFLICYFPASVNGWLSLLKKQNYCIYLKLVNSSQGLHIRFYIVDLLLCVLVLQLKYLLVKNDLSIWIYLLFWYRCWQIHTLNKQKYTSIWLGQHFSTLSTSVLVGQTSWSMFGLFK